MQKFKKFKSIMKKKDEKHDKTALLEKVNWILSKF